MKKIFGLITIITFCAVLSAQNAFPRFSTTPNGNNTGSGLTYGYFHVNVNLIGTRDTIVLVPSFFSTIYNTDTLKHALVDSFKTFNAYLGDCVSQRFVADTLSAGRNVTFVRTIKNAGTLTVPKSKKAIIQFMFDGTNWIETKRVITTN
jgi:hypothetical protein